MNEREIFADAMQIDSESERANYLGEACGDDQQMRERIEQLLREKDSLGSFLESPPPGVGTTADQSGITEKPGMLSRSVRSVFTARAGHQSEEFYQIFEELSPGPYLELLGRRTREGWTVVGNELEGRM